MLNDHSEPYIESNDNPKGIDLINNNIFRWNFNKRGNKIYYNK